MLKEFLANALPKPRRSSRSVLGNIGHHNRILKHLLLAASMSACVDCYIPVPLELADYNLGIGPYGKQIGYTVSGMQSGDNFGQSVSGIGDVNGDGYADFLVGSPTFSNNNIPESGAAFIFLGHGNDRPFQSYSVESLVNADPPLARVCLPDDSGAAQGYLIGTAVSGAGDFNRDGFDDFLISAPSAAGGLGVVYLILGQAAAFDQILVITSLSPNNPNARGIQITGDDSLNGNLGTAVAAAGDFNGDGFADILVASETSSAADGNGGNVGVIYVIYGRATAALAHINLHDFETSDTNGFVLYGAISGDRAGSSVGGIGDINNDGFDDVAIGAIYAFVQTTGRAGGVVYVIFGTNAQTENVNLVYYNRYVLYAPSNAAQLGYALSRAGDVNGDGFDDFVVGAPFARDESSGATTGPGYAFVIYGSTLSTPGQIDLGTVYGSTVGYRLVGRGDNDQDRFGGAVSAAGDVNGDGYADILVGTLGLQGSLHGYVYLIFGQGAHPVGALEMTSFVTGVQGLYMTTLSATDVVTCKVGAAGDINNDGYDDVLIGGCNAALNPNGDSVGAAFVIFGSNPLYREDDVYISVMGDNSALGFRLFGAAENAHIGTALAAGNFDGNNYNDLVVRSSVGTGLKPNCGTTNIVLRNQLSNGDVYLDGSIDLVVLNGGESDASTDALSGISISTGDVNNDERDDILIGAPGYLPSGLATLLYGADPLDSPFQLDAVAGSSDGVQVTSAGLRPRLGRAVSIIGDFDGDGYKDYVVSVYDEAKVFLILGTSTSDTVDIALGAYHKGMIVYGIPYTQTGIFLSPAGDINKDGKADFIVSAPDTEVEGKVAAGAVYVIYGQAAPFSNVWLSNYTDFVVYGAVAEANLGISTAAAGDVNADGIDDIIIGAPAEGTKGAAYVMFGSATKPGVIHLSSFTSGGKGFRMLGAVSGDEFGCSVSGAGDVNGDTIMDVIIGAHAPDGTGKAHVLYGKAGLRGDVDMATLNTHYEGFTIFGFTNGQELFGEVVSRAGDVNFDGFADVMVSAPNSAALGVAGAGMVYVIYGALTKSAPPTAAPSVVPTITPSLVPTGSPSFTVTASPTRPVNPKDLDLASFTSGEKGFVVVGAEYSAWVGIDIASAGDVNGDGRPDLLVSGSLTSFNNTRPQSGSVYVLYGQASGAKFATGVDLKMFEGTPVAGLGYRIQGASASGKLGYTISSAGDFNGDGIDDVMMASFAQPGRSNAGTVYVIFGTRTPPTENLDLLSFTSGSHGFCILGARANDKLGYSLSSAGDFNGDGFGDLIIGAVDVVTSPNGNTGAGGAVYILFGHSNTSAPFATVDLLNFSNGPRGIVIIGTTGDENENLGSAVAGGGDLNEDGFSDVIIGARAYSTGGIASGIVYVVFGTNQTLDTFYSTDDIYPQGVLNGFFILGVSNSERLGGSIEAVGDVNGDGLSDVLISARLGAVSGRTDAGIVYVLFGNATGPYPNINLREQVIQPRGFRILGVTGDRLGTVVGSAGDFNQDGNIDMLLASASATSGGVRTGGGMTYLIYGRAGSEDIDLNDLQSGALGFGIYGARPADKLGCAVTGGLDLNGDGASDIAIGAYLGTDLGRINPGAVYVLYGEVKPTSLPTALPTLTPSVQPTVSPSVNPSAFPTISPSADPSVGPTVVPSCVPSVDPSIGPSVVPSVAPSASPSTVPSTGPTVNPSLAPSVGPSISPSLAPSTTPTLGVIPVPNPTRTPSREPTGLPTIGPTNGPSRRPTGGPSLQPTQQLSVSPSLSPTLNPSLNPSLVPSVNPSVNPSVSPSVNPSVGPSQAPVGVPTPSQNPSVAPTIVPSVITTSSPVDPSVESTTAPTAGRTRDPSVAPSLFPGSGPTQEPTLHPSESPTVGLSVTPTAGPSTTPSVSPTVWPTLAPSRNPSLVPTVLPSVSPSRLPTRVPSMDTEVQLNITGVLIAAVRTSLTVRVMLSVPSVSGNVYCAAFSPPRILSSVADVVNQKFSTAVSSNTAFADVPIANLVASTSYTVYCTTISQQGTPLSLVQTRATAVSANTLCCKVITVRRLITSLPALTSAPNAVSITLDSLPSTELTIVVSLTDGVTYPSLFTVSSTSTTMYRMLTASAGAESGVKTIKLTLSGASAAEFSVVFVSGDTITVTAANEEPEVPQVLAAQFSSDGTYVSVVFNAPTNRGSYSNSFPCTQLLSFSGSATSTCQWADSVTIRIYPQAAVSSNLLKVGSEVTVVGGKITADCSASSSAGPSCSSWQKVPAEVVIVGAPVQPTAPVVSISAPATVSVCNALTVDLAGSSGSAGRSWSSVAFRVSIGGDVTSASLKVQNFLNQNYTLNPPTPVPSTLLQAGIVYSIQVTLCNFLGACGSNTASVSVLQAQDLIPIVSVLGATQRSIVRSATLTLTSNAFTQACGGNPSYSNLDLTWTVTSSTGDASAASIRSSSVDPTVFRLTPFTLNVGHQYSVVLTVRSRLSGLSSTAAVTVTVPASNLVAKIAGGAQRSLKFNSSVALDASNSYDEDVQGLFGLSAGLTFTWTCVQSLPTFAPECPLVLRSAGTPTGFESLVVVAPLSALNTSSLLTVTVHDTSQVRSSTAQVSVRVTGYVPAIVAVTSAQASAVSVNTDKKLVLYGSVQTLAPCTAVWSVSDAAVQLGQVATTPTSIVLPASVRPAAFNLVVAGGTLPQRATLVFTLTCGSSANSMSVTTNGSPLSGVFLVTPSEGDELSTLFQFSAAQWTDPDLPLTYQFGFQSVTSLSNLVVVSVSELSFTSSTLPAGADEDAGRLNCTLEVFDSFSASFLALRPINVNQVSGSEQRDALLLLVKSGTGSVDSAKNIISVVSAAMNSVNCSAAPNCTEINRNPCSKTSGECGTCIDGYIGDYGDRSTLCIPASFAFANATNARCESQTHCLYWQSCDRTLNECIVPQKLCSKECSNNGECLFTSLVTGDTLSTCSLADLTCAAACSCSDGFSGPTCATPLSNLQSRREIRSNLVTALHNLTTLENADKQSVSAWSASLYSVALNPYDLSVSDAAKVLQIANSTLINAHELVLDSAASLLGVLQATDTVFSVQKTNYIPNDFNDLSSGSARIYQNNTAQGIIEVVSAFAELQSQFMVLGETTSTYFYDNFRVSSQLAAFGVDAANVTISSPQSDFERLTDTAMASAVLTPSGDSSGTTTSVSVSVIAVSPRAYSPDTAQYKSNPLYLQITADSGEEAASAVSNIEFSFPFNERQDQFVSYQPVNFTFFCDHLDDAFSFKCPDSGTLLTSDCSKGRGEYTKFCPKPSPTCAQLDTASAEVTVAESCHVVAYNATYVTCSCPIGTSATPISRRLQQSAEQAILDETGVSNMIATAAYISMEFADTFNAAGDFTDPAAVLIVIIMFATLWGTGLVLLSFCFGKSYLSMQQKLKKMSKQVVAAISNVEAGQSMQDARERLLMYIDNVIPSVYSNEKSNAVRLFGELRSHHRYLTLFTLGDGEKTTFNKILLIVQVLTMETMQMFLLAVLYDVQGPDDDGSCSAFTNEANCLERTSIFDDSQSYCKWTDNVATGAASCSYHTPEFSIKVFIYILILTSIFTAIINTPLDYFFKVCAAPLIEDALEDRAANSTDNQNHSLAVVSKGLRRLSVQTNQTVQAVGRRGSAAILTTQKIVQKKFNLKSLHLSSKEKEADDVIADRAISEDLQQMHKHAVAGMSGLVQHSQTIQTQRQRHSQGLLVKAQSKRNNRMSGRVDPPCQEVREAQATGTSVATSDSGSSSSKEIKTSQAQSGPVAGAALGKVMLKLQDEVLCQRLLLPAKSSHLVAFDAQWGIVPVSDDVYHISDEALDTIAIDVEFAEKEAKELSERMHYYTLQHGGLSILNLFLIDLLGRRTIAAKIFKNKFEEDFQETRAVSQAYKAFAVALLLACNAFFIYYTLLKALQKGHTWQYQFLQGCVAQMLVEIFLNETLECVWLNYMVPDLARKEVQRVHTVLRQVVEQITDKANDVHKKTVLFLNAPSYLFSSTKVAQSHAHLLESVVVLNFQSHLPGELSRTWPHYKRWAALNTKDEMLVDPEASSMGGTSRWTSYLLRAVLAVGTATLLSMQYLGTLSFNLQRIVIRFVQPLLLSGLTLLWLFASSDPIALYFVICASFVAVLALFWRQHYLHVRARHLAKQIVPVDADDGLQDTDTFDDKSRAVGDCSGDRSDSASSKARTPPAGALHEREPGNRENDSSSSSHSKLRAHKLAASSEDWDISSADSDSADLQRKCASRSRESDAGFGRELSASTAEGANIVDEQGFKCGQQQLKSASGFSMAQFRPESEGSLSFETPSPEWSDDESS